jgi:hypothetical protein
MESRVKGGICEMRACDRVREGLCGSKKLVPVLSEMCPTTLLMR